MWSASEYARRLDAARRGDLVQVVAWHGDVPAGRGTVLFPAHPEYSVSAARERCAEVRDVFVTPARRRRGVATAIMRALEAAVAATGSARIGLAVSIDPDAAPARVLYDRLGYRAAHGPFISSGDLAGDDGPIAVSAVLTYLVKEL